MEEIGPLLIQLHKMIGAKVFFRNATHTVVEIVDDIPAIIMQRDNPASTIQADVHGRARKHTNEVIMIHVLNTDRTNLHEDFLDISTI